MFEVEEIVVKNGKVEYNYSTSKELSKFFSKNKLYIKSEVDFSEVPIEILTIPLLGNILPISWFAGFDIKVEKLDKEFYVAANKLKQQFSEYYPIINTKKSELIVNEIVDAKYETTNKTAMLFSGGVDVYTTFFRHYEEKPDLITIKGADIDVHDHKQWENVENYNTTTEAIKPNKKFSLEINLREFITFEVDKLMDGLGWWGKIQHGLGLTTACAPLSYVNMYNVVYIASSYTRKENYDFILWGSMPEIDNLISWGLTKIKHDASELTRQEKINEIIYKSKEIKNKPELRVCYNEFKSGLNCNKCEKCCRTIFAIMIMNEPPNKYGFDIDVSIFDYLNKIMKKRFTSEGNRLFWVEIYNQSLESDKYFNSHIPEWNKKYKDFIMNLENNINQGVHCISKRNKIKLDIVNKCPKLFNLYLKVRKSLL